MTDVLTINPLKKYVINGENCRLLTACKALTVGANREVIAAVSGKRHLIMGWSIQSTSGTVGTFYFRSNSGGTVIWQDQSVPVNTNGFTDHLPIADSGYFETETGHGLFTTITGADLNFNVFYLTYTP